MNTLSKIKTNTDSLQENMEAAGQSNHTLIINSFQDYITNFDSYCERLVIYPGVDKNVLSLREVGEKIDSLFLAANSLEDFNEILSSKAVKIFEEAFLTVEDRDIFFARKAEHQYLVDDAAFIKVNMYMAMKQAVKSGMTVQELFTQVYIHEYGKERFKCDAEVLQEVVKRYNFKSLTVEKDCMVAQIAAIMEKGVSEAKKIYQLSDYQVGADKLRVNFTTEQRVDGTAYYLPALSTLNFYIRSLSEASPSSFVHEYTHYLQDHIAFMMNVDYKNSPNNKLNHLEHWSEVESHVLNRRNTIEDTAYYMHEKLRTILNDEIEYEAVLRFIKDNLAIEERLFKSELQKFLFPFFAISNKQDKALFITTKKHGEIIPQREVEQVVNDLLVMHQAHHDERGFLQSLWEKMDSDAGRVYFMNQLEIHARLVEKITDIKIPLDKHIEHYPCPALISEIQPLLEKFNEQIINFYKITNFPKEYWEQFNSSCSGNMQRQAQRKTIL